MLLPNERTLLNKMNSTAANVALGDVLYSQFGVKKGTYRFARDGGAIGSINLKDDNGVVVKLPSKAIVLNAFVHVVQACTSGGSMTLDIDIQSDNDLLAAQAVAGLTLNAKIQCIPDFATLGDAIVLTAERTLAIDINTATLTAGKLDVFVFYVLSE